MQEFSWKGLIFHVEMTVMLDLHSCVCLRRRVTVSVTNDTSKCRPLSYFWNEIICYIYEFAS